MNLKASDIPNTIIADITDCRDTIPDESFDLVLSSDVFEHIDRPWLAAAEIGRILKPGGLAITHTLFAWRNHPCPIDYWRYSPECLEFLFADLECLEKGYDLSQRRMNQPGFWPSGKDSVPIDHLGGWREHWSVYIVSRKGSGPPVARFKDSDHPLAVHLRQDTQGVVTNPKLTKTAVPPPPDPLKALRPALAQITDQLGVVCRNWPRSTTAERPGEAVGDRDRSTGRHRHPLPPTGAPHRPGGRLVPLADHAQYPPQLHRMLK